MQPTAAQRGDTTAVDVDIGRVEGGVSVRDRNARERCHIGLASSRCLRTADESAAGISTERFPVPVSTAVEALATGLELPEGVVVIRDRQGDYVSRADDVAFRTFTEGRYLLEIHGAVHCVVGFESSFTLSPDGRTLSFDHESPVRIGARSARPRPTKTVTTTEDPADVMAAVSTFGSVLATRAPERSFPAFRGHPPELELGSKLRIPDGLEPTGSEVTIELPARLEYAYAAAPLAAYLDASVEPGSRAALVTDSFSYSLDGRGGVEASLARVLKQVFVLDVACRGAGPYPGESHERRAVEAATDLDWARLYEADPAERLEAYLSVPFHAVETSIPQWGSAAQVQPAPENARLLPSLVAAFATVRSPPTVPHHSTTGRNWADADAVEAGSNPTRPEPSDAVEDVWVGTGAPVGATKAVEAGYRNRFERRPAWEPRGPEQEPGVAVLAPNPAQRDVAERVAAVYDDPTLATGLSRAELRRRLAEPWGVAHFVGDVSEEGFDCLDGSLDAERLDAVGVDTFVMDACSAHQQATALVAAGALGGIATFHEEPAADAQLGATLARLLDAGFPLAAAADMATDAGFAREGFLVAGDGTTTLPNTGARPPTALVAESLASGYAVRRRGYAADTASMGSRTRSAFDDAWLLTAARERPETLDGEALKQLMRETGLPLLVDGDLVWQADDLDLDTERERSPA